MSVDLAPVDDGNCFACGPENPIGLRLTFAADAEGVTTTTTLAGTMQGWAGFAHGGVVMMLLDEAMAYAGAHAGLRCVSADVRVRFRQPTPLETEIRVRGSVAWRRGSVVGLTATILDAAGTVLASGEGRFLARGTIDPTTLRGAVTQ